MLNEKSHRAPACVPSSQRFTSDAVQWQPCRASEGTKLEMHLDALLERIANVAPTDLPNITLPSPGSIALKRGPIASTIISSSSRQATSIPTALAS